MKFFVALLCVALAGCGASSVVLAAPTVTGTFKGQVIHDPLFPALDFNVVVDVAQLNDSGDIVKVSATLVRDATECWTTDPVVLHGNFVIKRNGGAIVLRQLFLQNDEGTVLLRGDLKADLSSGHFFYNSIVPDRHPCQSITAAGDLSR